MLWADALSAFRQRVYAIQNPVAFAAPHANEKPVREHTRATNNEGLLCARSSQNRGRLAGYRAFADQRHPFDYFAVSGDDVIGFYQHEIAATQCFRFDHTVLAAIPTEQPLRVNVSAHGLNPERHRVAVHLGNGLRKVDEQECQP
jgi:hypothetical protein